MEHILSNQSLVQHTFQVQKLIRDHLPAVIRQSGILVKDRVLHDAEYAIELRKKLLEEACEVQAASESREITEELADVLEVIQALAHFHGIDFLDVEQKAAEKKHDKGGFQERLYVNCVSIPSDHPKLAEYRAQPAKYPEIKDL